MKFNIFLIAALFYLFEHCSAQTYDSIHNLKWKSYEILNNINDQPLFALDTNGFTFQFGFNSVLKNIHDYFYNNKNKVEDSLLLVFVKSLKNINTEINVNKFGDFYKNRIIHHFGDLMSKGNCKIIKNENNEIISRISCLGYLNYDHSGGISFNLLGKIKVYEDILQIETEK